MVWLVKAEMLRVSSVDCGLLSLGERKEELVGKRHISSLQTPATPTTFSRYSSLLFTCRSSSQVTFFRHQFILQNAKGTYLPQAFFTDFSISKVALR